MLCTSARQYTRRLLPNYGRPFLVSGIPSAGPVVFLRVFEVNLFGVEPPEERKLPRLSLARGLELPMSPDVGEVSSL